MKYVLSFKTIVKNSKYYGYEKREDDFALRIVPFFNIRSNVILNAKW